MSEVINRGCCPRCDRVGPADPCQGCYCHDELGTMPVPLATLSELAFLSGQFREEQARNPLSRPPDGSWALRFAELAERLLAEVAP